MLQVSADKQQMSMDFIQRPQVTAVLPTNGIFDGNTELSLTGRFFCGTAANLPCNTPDTLYSNWWRLRLASC
jgi:hypothetical protein